MTIRECSEVFKVKICKLLLLFSPLIDIHTIPLQEILSLEMTVFSLEKYFFRAMKIITRMIYISL